MAPVLFALSPHLFEQRRAPPHHVDVPRVGVKLESDQIGSVDAAVDHFVDMDPAMEFGAAQK